jgi:hypothetical protein
MRKTLSTFVVLLLALTVVVPQKAHAEMPAKAKAFLTIAGYGAGGGAILGAASTAFGTSSRAIAQGASLGLYAGILFGTYVLVSHHNKRYGSYDDKSSPYQESSDIYGDEYREDEGGSEESSAPRGGFFDRHQKLQGKFQKKGSDLPPLHINLLQYNF